MKDLDIKIERTEQWEYTASGYGMDATGSSEMSAELNLLRKIMISFLGVFETAKKTLISGQPIHDEDKQGEENERQL